MGLGRGCRLASDKRPRRQRPGAEAQETHGAQEAAGQESWEHALVQQRAQLPRRGAAPWTSSELRRNGPTSQRGT